MYKDKRWKCPSCDPGLLSCWMPDVYWDGKPVETLTDDRGKSMVFLSKRHKATWMRANNISERGDRQHGSLTSDFSFNRRIDAEKHKHETQMAFKRAADEIRRKYRV